MKITEYSDGRKNGIEISYYSNRQVKELRYYEQGKKEGNHKGWWPDGKQRFEFNFVNDVYHGNQREWNTHDRDWAG